MLVLITVLTYNVNVLNNKLGRDGNMSDLGNKEIMSRNIQYYMDLNNKTRQEMCDALGVKYSTFTDWVNGNTYPRIDKIEMMANYFGIKKSDLVEEWTPDMVKENEEIYVAYSEETQKIAQEIFDDKDIKLLFDLKKSTQSDELMRYARYLKKMHDEENNL